MNAAYYEILEGSEYFSRLRQEKESFWQEDSFPLSLCHSKTDKMIFSCQDRGFVAFEKFCRTWVVAGEPVIFSSQDSKEDLLREFYKEAQAQGQRVCGYYTSQPFMSSVFSYFRLGVSHIVDLSQFHLEGHASKEVRRALNVGEREKLEFISLEHKDKDQWLSQVLSHYGEWLQAKKQPEVKFLLSRPQKDFSFSQSERWYVVCKEGRLQAFVSLLPYGDRSWYLDSMLQCNQGHKMALDFLLARLTLQLKEQDQLQFCMGLNAFCIEDPESKVEKMVSFSRRFRWPYSSSGLYFFKGKFTGKEKNRFFFVEKGRGLIPQIIALFWVTFIGGSLRRSRQKT